MADIFCFHLRPFFALLPHYWTRKLKFGKNVKNTLKYYSFTHVYPKWRSYNVSFLRYKMQSTLTLLNTRKMKILKKMKKNAWRYHFTLVDHTWLSYDVRLLRYRVRQTEFLVIFGYFPVFYHTSSPKNQDFEKMKKDSLRFYHFTH